MHDRIDTGERSSNCVAIADVAAHELEAFVAIEGQQRFAAIDELVEDGDAIAGLKQMRGHARAEITGAAGDENVLHCCHATRIAKPLRGMKPSTQKLGLPVAIRCQSRVEPILTSFGEFDRTKLGPDFALKRIRSTFNPAGVCKYFVSSFSISDGSCERLTGFRETNYDDIRAKLKVDGRRLQSLINGKSYGIGEIELVGMLGLEYGRVGSGGPHVRSHIVKGHLPSET